MRRFTLVYIYRIIIIGTSFINCWTYFVRKQIMKTIFLPKKTFPPSSIPNPVSYCYHFTVWKFPKNFHRLTKVMECRDDHALLTSNGLFVHFQERTYRNLNLWPCRACICAETLKQLKYRPACSSCMRGTFSSSSSSSSCCLLMAKSIGMHGAAHLP